MYVFWFLCSKFLCIQYWIGLCVVMQSIAAASVSSQPICLVGGNKGVSCVAEH